MLGRLRRFACDDCGQGLVEYALILALIAIVLVVALTSLGAHTKNSLSNSANLLPG